MLSGLTIVLVDANVDHKHDSPIARALEWLLAAAVPDPPAPPAEQLRVFSVSDKLIELREIPESFGSLALPATGGRARIAEAVNRVNIVKPARIVVITGLVSNLGRPREGTHGYVWHAQQELVPRTALEGWSILFCDPAEIVNTIRMKESTDGAAEAPVR